MKKPPAFQFYADDFLGGVSDMTQTEIGAYILLLCHQWNGGKISDDKPRLALIAKGDVSDHVLSKFPNGKNKRLEVERKKQQLYRESRALNGKLGGRPCKAHENHMVSETKAKLSSPSPSPSPSPIKERESSAPAHFPECEIPSWKEFWAYCQTQECLLPAEWFAKDKWEAANQVGWQKMANWKAYARRCKTWWESDGRKMQPTQKDESGKPIVKEKSLAVKIAEKL